MGTSSAPPPLHVPLLLGKAFIVQCCAYGMGSFGPWALTVRFAYFVIVGGGFCPIALEGDTIDREEIPLRCRDFMDPGPPPRLWKILTKLPTIPKVRFFGWRCGRDALPVGSRLRDVGLSDGAFPLCDDGFEDVLHVLRDCPDSSTVLCQAGFNGSLLSTDQVTVVGWLGLAASSLSLSSFALLLSVLWGLWRRRNTWIHERLPARCRCSPHWRPPPVGYVKVNVDGAFLPYAGLGAIGVLSRDSSGAVLGGFAKPIPIQGPASTVEVAALFAGLEFAVANDWPSALIKSDAAVLVNKLHRPTVDLSLLGDMLAPSCALLTANAARFRVGFTPRLANIATHSLASWACNNNDVITFSSVCPEFISRIKLDDLSSSF
ncbi:hypothetical protein GQ457_18G008310 [Hibiscus cannabinus]